MEVSALINKRNKQNPRPVRPAPSSARAATGRLAGAAVVLAVFTALLFPAAQAQTPSKQQMDYFQSLSPSEQRRLAEQYGVSVPDSQSQKSQQTQLPQTIYRPGESPNQFPQNGRQSFGNNGQSIDMWSTPPGFSQQRRRRGASDDELPIFGMDVFAGQATSFTPIGDLPVPADYIVAPGDQINIQLYGKQSEQYELVVSRDGKIHIPDLGPFSVVGKRFYQVKEELQEKFQQQIIGAQVAVSLGELHSMQVYILGDAQQPGAYQLSSLATATQAIIAAGGIADTGSLRQVEVRRGSELVARLDLYDLLVNGNRGGDVRLQSGDAVFIPATGPRVKVKGEVLRPAIYELTPSRRSVAEIVAYAGGALPSAASQRLRVERMGAQGVDVFALDLSASQDRQFKLQDGDKVFLDKQSEAYRDSIQLSGAFISPGQHGFTEGMRISDVIASPGAVLREEADTNQAILVRTGPDNQISVRYVSLRQVMQNPASSENVTLQLGDELLVLPAFVLEEREHDSDKQERGAWPQRDSQNRQGYEQNSGQPQYSGRQTQQGYLDQERGASSQYLRQQQYFEQQRSYQQQQQLDAGMLGREQKGRSAKEDRMRDELMFQQVMGEVHYRRAMLLAPIVEKLKEQADGEAQRYIVEVAGEVKYPGEYPYMPGMSLQALVQIAGGLQESAFSETAEMARLMEENGRLVLQTSRVPLTGNAVAEFQLRPRDQITVFQRPEWRDTVAVKVSGEVRFPGTYTVERGTGFTQLLERAGGLTEFAFPQGAVFSREKLKEREQEQIDRLRDRLKEEVATLSLRKSSGMSGLSVAPSEAIAAVDELNSTEALGRLVIDLPALLESEKTKVPLEDGDFLHIPNHSKTVTVVGEVQYPSSHLFEEGVSYKDYLERAGGPRQRADKGRIYIIRANGQVVVAKNSWFGAKIKEGDTIVVPINANYVDKLSVFGSVTQILYQLGIAYDVIKN